MKLRPFQPADTQGIIDLIDAIYREYDDRIHLEDAESDLTDIAANYAPGRFQVLEDTGAIRGTVALVFDAQRPGVCILKRLYLDSELRGADWAGRMLDWATAEARDLDIRRMELWSDIRFERAHAFYSKHGFVRDGKIRTLHDAWQPYTEYFYFKEL